MAADHFPKIVFCAGLPRSASTWAFNAIRLILNEVSHCSGEYADSWDLRLASIQSADSIVVKMHNPDIPMCMLSRLAELPVVFTVRDPRDCVVSLIVQFGYSFEKAFTIVGNSAEALMRLYRARHELFLLRYENDISEPFATLKRLAQHLSIDVPNERLDLINEQLTPDAIERLIGELTARHVFDERPYAEQWDPSTHWHPNHVGDRQIGKYKAVLSEGQSISVYYATRDFCKQFGYSPEPPRKIPLPAEFPFDATGISYLAEGFSRLEPWGVWTDGSLAQIVLPLTRRTGRIELELHCALSPSFLAPDSRSSLRLELNGKPAARVDASDHRASEFSVILTADDEACEQLVITLIFENLRSPAELGISDDQRMLGIGVRGVKITDRSLNEEKG